MCNIYIITKYEALFSEQVVKVLLKFCFSLISDQIILHHLSVSKHGSLSSTLLITKSERSVTIALLMAVDLRLCGTHFPTTSELSQFVLTSPTAKRRMLKPLASV